MKKLFMVAAMTSVALAGCVSETEDVGALEESKNLISFASPVVSPNTRAVAGEINGNPYPTKETFNVYARYSKDPYSKWESSQKFMSNVMVQKSTAGSNYWESEEPYYWPKVGYLTFAAYSPTRANTDGSIGYGKTGFTFKDFKIKPNGYNSTKKEDESVQYDLMYSTRTLNKTESTGGTSYNGVDINFKHALSSIKFTIKTKYDGATPSEGTIKLKGITLKNIKSNGTFVETIKDGDTYNASPKWGDASVPTTATYTVFSSASGEDITNQSTAKNVSTFANGYDLILRPQEFSDPTPVIEVVWINNGIEQTATQALNGLVFTTPSNSSTWEIGYRYTYNITIDLKKIYFSPEVETWKDATGGGDINI